MIRSIEQMVAVEKFRMHARWSGDPGTTIAVEAQETGKHAGLFLCTFDFIGQAIATP